MECMITRQGSNLGFELKFAQTDDTCLRILFIHVNVRSEGVDLSSVQAARFRFIDRKRVEWHCSILTITLAIWTMMMVVMVLTVMEMVWWVMVVVVGMMGIRSEAALQVYVEYMAKDIVSNLGVG